jgi:dienelactone hydrolase
MKRSILLAIVALLPSATALAGGADPLVGYWTGSMTAQGARMPVSFEFASGDAGLEGRFTSTTQRAMDYPLDSVSRDGAAVRFVLGGDLTFDGRIEGDGVTGTFKGGDLAGEVSLRRTAKPALPYRTSEVTFRNGDATLAGTLASPATPGRHPAVVLLQGSGPETRWGTNRFIADRFARAGIVTLIFDKRGTGGSTGDWRTADFDALAGDALAGMALLRARPEVDAGRIGLHGHSQGGIVAPIAAALAGGAVAFVVAQDHSELEAASAPVAHESWFAWLDIPPRDSWLWAWYPRTGSVDTLEAWRKVRCPVLLVYGQRDRLVPVDDSIRQIEAALDRAGTSYAAWIAPRAEHNLTVRPQPGEPFFWWHAAPGIIESVAAWILAAR